MLSSQKVRGPLAKPKERVSVQRRRLLRSKRNALLLGSASILIVLVVWSILSEYALSPLLLPSPLTVVREGYAMARTGELLSSIQATMVRLVLGYILGALGGIIVGGITARTRLVRGMVLPLVNLIRPLSPVALIPLFIIWFGIGETSKILLVSYTTFVTLYFSAAAGVSSTPIIRERAARSMGAGRIALAWHVIVPSAVPEILTGLRIALSAAYMTVVAAELIAAKAGLGYVIMSARINLLTTRMFVGLVCLGILGLLSDILLRKIATHFGRRFLGDEISQSL